MIGQNGHIIRFTAIFYYSETGFKSESKYQKIHLEISLYSFAEENCCQIPRLEILYAHYVSIFLKPNTFYCGVHTTLTPQPHNTDTMLTQHSHNTRSPSQQPTPYAHCTTVKNTPITRTALTQHSYNNHTTLTQQYSWAQQKLSLLSTLSTLNILLSINSLLLSFGFNY